MCIRDRSLTATAIRVPSRVAAAAGHLFDKFREAVESNARESTSHRRKVEKSVPSVRSVRPENAMGNPAFVSTVRASQDGALGSTIGTSPLWVAAATERLSGEKIGFPRGDNFTSGINCWIGGGLGSHSLMEWSKELLTT